MLTLSRWDHLSSSDQEEAAYAVASRLPEPFRFDGLETHQLGQQRHRVAFFTWNKARFALIPGGLATLGHAPGSFIPTEAHLQSLGGDTPRVLFGDQSSVRARCPTIPNV
jgi:hypothetical protein